MSEIIQIDLNGVNCYLLKGSEGFILFDTGGPLAMDKVFNSRRDELLKQLSANGCMKGNLSLIVLTHGDCDHTYNAAWLRDNFGAKIAMHGGDRHLTENPTIDDWMRSFNFKPIVMRLVSIPLKAAFKKPIQRALDSFTPFAPDIELTDGFDLNAYGLDAKVIYAPGHTDGSVAVLTSGGGLIAGDIPSANALNFAQREASIKKLKSLPVKKVYQGHGAQMEMAALR